MYIKVINIFTIFLYATLYTAFSYAGYTVDSVTPYTILTPPPPIVSNSGNTPTSNTDWFFFAEQQGVSLPAILPVDGINPTDTHYTLLTQLTPGSISAGTIVNSYLLFTQPTSPSLFSFAGQITFSNPVIGVQVNRSTLEGISNSQIILPGSIHNLGGFELTGSGASADSFTLSNNMKTVAFTFSTGSPGIPMDAIRFVTIAPEPKTYLILSSILAFTIFFSIRKKTSKLNFRPFQERDL
jgi:hypothetical protein